MSFSHEPPAVHYTATSTTLLRNLREYDCPEQFEAAWRRFHQKYVAIIVRWCERRWGLEPEAADDVAAEVMIKVLRSIRQFHYRKDGSFRAWLFTVTRRAMIDYARSERRVPGGCGDVGLNELEARDDLLQRLQKEFDLELLAEARRRVAAEASVRDWGIFQALTEQGRPPQQVADELGLNRNHVDTIKDRVLRRLRQQIRELEEHGIQP
ncbi:MAG: sigma-70 family RNA polymerase sigma factor [Pirellulaceae bacterium]|nr:sigma-70 family RNA polymerase sigma factor [Pirellulaceae bacterium]